jgi:hypothetical protein
LSDEARRAATGSKSRESLAEAARRREPHNLFNRQLNWQTCHASGGQLDAGATKWVIGFMTQAQREIIPGWRAGLLVLGFYAMFLQSFFAALAGPVHTAAGPDGASICVSSAALPEKSQEPVKPHTGQDCVCAAMCHGAAGGLGHAPFATTTLLKFSIASATTYADRSVNASIQRALPPARAPPREGFVFFS